MSGTLAPSPAFPPLPRLLFRALVLAVVVLFGGGVLTIAAPVPAHADPVDPVYYREDGTLVESYADCVTYECPSGFSPPVMVDMPGTIGDLFYIPPNRTDTMPTPGWTMTYTVNDARVAGVGPVTVTGRRLLISDNPFITELIWPFMFTADEWPYTDECGTDNDTFLVPADVSWTAPEPSLGGPPSSLSIVYTVFDGRVDGEGMVIVRAMITTEVGSGPVASLQNYAYEFTNEACGPVEPPPPPPVEPPAPTQPPVDPPPVTPPTTITVTPPPSMPSTGADVTAATIIGALGVLGGAIALSARRIRRRA